MTQDSLNFDQQEPRRVVTCEHCGAKVAEYRHHMGKPLVAGLLALHRAGGQSKLDDLGLTLSQANNFQKLRYWDLIEKGAHGVWVITRLGVAFIEERARVRKVVRTFRGQRVGFEEGEVSITELADIHYRQRGDYAADASTHGAVS